MHGKNFRVRNQFDLLVSIFDSVMKKCTNRADNVGDQDIKLEASASRMKMVMIGGEHEYQFLETPVFRQRLRKNLYPKMYRGKKNN